MTGLRIRLLCQPTIEVDEHKVKLRSKALSVLIRLIAANGVPVTVQEIYRDVWPKSGANWRDDRGARTLVQRQIMEIRQVLDPDLPGEQSVVVTDLGPVSAYRLVVPREAVDVFQFIDLVTRSRMAAPRDKIAHLEQALGLWLDKPLGNFAGQPWTAELEGQLNDLHETARLDLTEALRKAGREDDALRTVEPLHWKKPGDKLVAESVWELRAQVRANQHKRVIRKGFAAPEATVVVLAGDLFDQDDAHLVVGFTDTFDTDTYRDIVINGETAQGALLRRLYDGNHQQLDSDLRAALKGVPKAAVESRTAKKRGKLTRYPLGTVATLRHPARRVFAVAYSQMGNDLIARSSLDLLSLSLANLWDAVYLEGQLKPVAMPLVGSGLSRIHATRDDLLALIVGSFLASARQRHFCGELRIVVPEDAFDEMRIAEILESASLHLEPSAV
jgi:DNA-binding SARP family transcriptional activator